MPAKEMTTIAATAISRSELAFPAFVFISSFSILPGCMFQRAFHEPCYGAAGTVAFVPFCPLPGGRAGKTFASVPGRTLELVQFSSQLRMHLFSAAHQEYPAEPMHPYSSLSLPSIGVPL